MNNETLRKTIIVLALISVIILVIMIIRNSMTQEVMEDPEVEDQAQVVETFPAVIYEVVYTNEGFSPAQSTGDLETILNFINNSDNSLEIEFINRPELNMFEILPNEEGGSLPLSQTEVYEFRNANNPEHTGSIEILDSK